MSRQPVTSHRVNGPALWATLDAQRQARGLSWRGVARDSGASTGALFTRLRRDDMSLHGDALVSLLVWLGMAGEIQPLILTATEKAPSAGPVPMVDTLVHLLRTATVSELQQAFRQCGMTLTFELSDDEAAS